MARKNADGWGMGFYNGAGPSVRRSLTSADADPEFLRLAATPLGDTGIVHLRSATPPLEVSHENSHPFVHGDLMMAHNGAIFPQEDLDAILPAAWRGRPRGATDSERYFLAVVAAHGGGLHARRGDPAHGLRHPRALQPELPERVPHHARHALRDELAPGGALPRRVLPAVHRGGARRLLQPALPRSTPAASSSPPRAGASPAGTRSRPATCSR